MQSEVYKYLRFAEFKSIFQWDLKRYLNKSFKSKYGIVELGAHIKEESKKYAISEKGKRYGILGVNNQTGIFDAYTEDGSKIKQKYKKMETGWIAYNPYRVNVGSIGIKKPEHKFEYISPAYVVFSCQPSLLPDYLFLVMKTPVFNKIIRDNTTGSVRQNLSYDVLEGLQIPLPSLDVQQALVKTYNDRILQAQALMKQASLAVEGIEAFLLEKLGIESRKGTDYQRDKNGKDRFRFMRFVTIRDVKEWGYDRLTGNNIALLRSTMFQNERLSELTEINPTTSFSSLDKKDDVSFIPMECISDEYGEWVERRTCKVNSSKGYTKFMNGDLIWARITPCMQNGKSAIVDELENGFGCGSTEFHVLRNHNENLNLHYVHALLRMPIVLKDAMKYFTGSAGQQRVPKSYLESLSIPLPPCEVQNAIVKHINEQKEQIMELKKQAEKLRKEALEEFEKEIFE